VVATEFLQYVYENVFDIAFPIINQNKMEVKAKTIGRPARPSKTHNIRTSFVKLK